VPAAIRVLRSAVPRGLTCDALLVAAGELAAKPWLGEAAQHSAASIVANANLRIFIFTCMRVTQ